MIDFHAAVQDPRNAFTDPELQAGKVAVTQLGLPRALGGTFALTYTVQTGRKKFAVRCFHREVPDVQFRYAKISSKLRMLASPYFVNFEFQSKGIRVQRAQYPVVKMDWAEGDTLSMYLDRWASNRSTVSRLRQAFATLADYLEGNSISHGDIQNENVIIENDRIRLIDYDGMFVSGLPEGNGAEVGHKHFQHPERSARHFGSKMDRFSFIVLDTSFAALQEDPTLYDRFREGGQTVIFKANDFVDPESSEVFGALRSLPALRESANKLASICNAPITNVPTLSAFKAGLGIPTRGAPAPVKKVAPSYIGAFEVLDANDFASVLPRVGDRVELVGRIVSVKPGVGRSGRGRGLPFIFINFGVESYNSVKITIWSDVLEKIKIHPNDTWAGRWISVTGLVDLYERPYFKPFRNLGITLSSSNQIISLSEEEARFRLGARAPATGLTSNTRILRNIRNQREELADPPVQTPAARSNTSAPRPPPQVPGTRNQDILRRLRSSATQVSPSPSNTPPPASSSRVSSTRGWFVSLLMQLVGKK
jgi:hypothetical protein